MPSPTSQEELVATVARLRELMAKATPGPYRAHDHSDMARLGEDPEKWMGYAWVGRITKQSEPDGRFDAGWLDRDSRKDASKEYRERASVDAHFVAEALNALPALLDLIERLTSAPAGEDADAEVERILAMSDEQILAEADACDLDWARGVKLGIKIGKGITAPSPVARVPDELRGKIKDIINQHVGECARLGGNLHMPVLHPGPAADRILALFTAAASDGWHLVETAPHACHVLAARFDGDEWAMAVVSSPPSKPFTHWCHLPNAPSSSPETSGDDVGVGR